jgi:hypothetical protein
MLLETVPLIVLFEASLILARVFGRPSEEKLAGEIVVSESR